MYILLAIVLLGVLITVHEFGHFAAARLCGIPVKEYSIGFGPKLVQWKSKKHETVFSIRPIPLGGYCMFFGDTDDDPNGEKKDDPRNYNTAPVWKRMISVAAGPLMNMVLAFVVLMLYFWIGGAQVPVAAHPYISQVESGPAQEAGLQAGDVITRIDGVDVLDGTTDTLINAIAAYDGDGPMLVTVQRGDTTFDTEITPFYDETEG